MAVATNSVQSAALSPTELAKLKVRAGALDLRAPSKTFIEMATEQWGGVKSFAVTHYDEEFDDFYDTYDLVDVFQRFLETRDGEESLISSVAREYRRFLVYSAGLHGS